MSFMQLSWDAIQANALAFSKRWKDGHDEKSEAQSFVRDFLAVFGVEDASIVGRFEERALRETGRGFMDYFWAKKIAIEMKSRGKNLADAYEQLKDYVFHLKADEMPELLMVSDFDTIVLFRRSAGEKKQFKTKDLHKHIRRFAEIAGYETTREIEDQAAVNVAAAVKMAKLHDALKAHGYEGHELEVYLVRLLFCLFAEDTGIFPLQSFLNYVENSKAEGSDLSERIGKLFEVLNMPEEVRAKKTLLSADLKQFCYVNGGLFQTLLPSAEFDARMRATLLDCCRFDWSQISPAIFGAMFQGVKKKEERRELGEHYTSEANILKLIKPLFLDDLRAEFERIKANPLALEQFHEKISRLTFLDPACGCGNFLIITYRELRLLELDLLKMKVGGQKVLNVESLLKVNVEQFYGIELEDFPCQIAQVGMWLIDHQMNLRVAEPYGQYFTRLPLTHSATIVRGNALRMDWKDIVPKEELSYILGNPPFIGYSNQSAEQKDDILSVYLDANGKPYKTAGKIDYVAAWYYKTAQILAETPIRAAFVSTNSITQGEQVAAVWKPLFEMFGVNIDFAYRTFKWGNEAKGKAAVHCLIVGFSYVSQQTPAPFGGTPFEKGALGSAMIQRNVSEEGKVLAPFSKGVARSAGGLRVIYESDGTKIPAKNISPYLVDAPNVFVESRKTPLCDVPEMKKGNIPVDDGNLIIEGNEIEQFLKNEPQAAKYVRKLLGADEYINKTDRYCLWLVEADPTELRKMPLVMERIEKCRAFREGSPKDATRKFADFPSLFMEIRQPKSTYILIPRHSSEKRRYIPFGFMDSSVITTDANSTIANASLYHFGILISIVHMAWLRAVCGRIKSDYRYSNDVVYNNFPWPNAKDEQKTALEKLAQAVLDARASFPESSLADLYGSLMPPELVKAHQSLDRAVIKLYDFSKDISEADIVAKLMEKYQKLAGTPVIPA